MIDRSRHATTGRFRATRQSEQSRGLPKVYGGRARRTIRDIYEVDHAHGGSDWFRWMISTCLAATVGAVVIGVVLYSSLNGVDASKSTLEQLSTIQQPTPIPLRLSVIGDGLNWAIPKSNRLHNASGLLTARYTIHEQVKVRRNNRPFIQIRPYLRLSMRLVPASSTHRDVIPAFNPFKLYAALSRADENDREADGDARQGNVKTRVVELIGGILYSNDGQELDNQEVTALIREARGSIIDHDPQGSLDQVGVLPGNLTPAYLSQTSGPHDSSITEATTVLYRATRKSDLDDRSSDRSEIQVVQLGRPPALVGILRRMGATSWQSLAMVEAATSIVPEKALLRGHEIRVRLVTHADRLQPEAFAIFGPLNEHLVTVQHSDDGDFVATGKFDPRIFMTSETLQSANAGDASLYASIYYAALMQNLPPDEIMKILRIYAYEMDFRRRVRTGDQLELLYELKRQSDSTQKPGELLYTAISSGGEKTEFWRFRTKDGAVEYYNQAGENSKKFLMRKPVRGSNVRLTSGFGYRRHPILNKRRMHNAADWAAKTGTPILAAGRGIVEVAKRRGANGNYVRIKHANGYQTTYSHMLRFGAGIRPGVKVRQGQIIGYVGTTGLSSGPHLHYEVLVNKRFVNPLKIRVPRARKLRQQELSAYQRERNRVAQLLRRSPVKTASR